MRTFIAIPLPRECQSMLEKVQDSLRAFQADVRWAAIPSIHLTLKFLGEIDRSSSPRLSGALKEIAAAQPFPLSIRGLGGFPNLHSPRVIWCGVEGDSAKLAGLQTAVEKACETLGLVPEDRIFHPHLTLGRVQGKKNLQPLLDYIRIGTEVEASFTVDHFNLYQSVLTPHGAKYTILEQFELK